MHAYFKVSFPTYVSRSQGREIKSLLLADKKSPLARVRVKGLGFTV
jgi:hypothetical protein